MGFSRSWAEVWSFGLFWCGWANLTCWLDLGPLTYHWYHPCAKVAEPMMEKKLFLLSVRTLSPSLLICPHLSHFISLRYEYHQESEPAWHLLGGRSELAGQLRTQGMSGVLGIGRYFFPRSEMWNRAVLHRNIFFSNICAIFKSQYILMKKIYFSDLTMLKCFWRTII